MARGGELSDFRVIHCEFRGFHFSLFESKNGRRILRNLPKWGAIFKIFRGIYGLSIFWTIARIARNLWHLHSET